MLQTVTYSESENALLNFLYQSTLQWKWVTKPFVFEHLQDKKLCYSESESGWLHFLCQRKSEKTKPFVFEHLQYRQESALKEDKTFLLRIVSQQPG